MAEKFDAVDEKFDAVDAKFDAVDARFEAIDARFEAIDARFDAVDEKFDAVDARFDAVDTRFEAIDARFDAVDAKFKEIDSGFEAVDDKFTSMKIYMDDKFDELPKIFATKKDFEDFKSEIYDLSEKFLEEMKLSQYHREITVHRYEIIDDKMHDHEVRIKTLEIKK